MKGFFGIDCALAPSLGGRCLQRSERRGAGTSGRAVKAVYSAKFEGF